MNEADKNKNKDKTELKPLGLLSPPTHISVLRFSPCGGLLAGASFDGRVRRWDLRELDEDAIDGKTFPAAALPDVTGHNGFVTGLDFDPNKHRAISCDSWGAIRAWPLFDDEPEPVWSLADAHDGWIRDLAVSPDGTWFATTGRDRALRRFATADGTRIEETGLHHEDVFALAISPDGKRIASADMRARIIVQEVGSGKLLNEVEAEGFYTMHRLQDLAGVRKLAFTPDGKGLVVAGTIPNTGGFFKGQAQLRIIDLASGKVRHDIAMGVAAKDVFVHDFVQQADGLLYAATCGQPGAGHLVVRHPDEKEARLLHKKGTVNCHSLALSPDGRRIAVVATNTGSNGNGKRLDKEGKYAGNHSPIHLFEV